MNRYAEFSANSMTGSCLRSSGVTTLSALLVAATLTLNAGCSSTGPQRMVTPARSGPVKVVPARESAEPQYRSALALLREGRLPEAISALQTLMREHPQYSGPPTALGIAHAQARQPALAIEAFSKAVAVNPANATAWNWLGSLRREAGDHGAAEQAYLRAIAAQPDHAAAQLNLAILYDVSLRRRELALKHYREYQRLAGRDKPIVSAWIRELEDGPAPVNVAGAAP
jgi:tetratricopeptide (TPR) repeat protein